jgi:protein-S-isoprenylcysteine O-methyltransferase Ste14
MNKETTLIIQEKKLDKDGKRRFIVIFAMFGVEAAILFLAAGRLDWTAAWVYLGMRILATAVFSVYILRTNPEIINERGRSNPEKTKPWDKVFGAIYAPTLFIAPLVAGLDAVRFGWSSVPLVWQIVGGLLMIPAIVLPYWAMAVNPFLVTTVRLQDERGHYVVNVGPYRYVRHPMYSGVLLLSVAAPLLLGSLWMFVPNAVASLAFIIRTALEDRTLQAELPGYADFTRQTRYRLLPGVW